MAQAEWTEPRSLWSPDLLGATQGLRAGDGPRVPDLNIDFTVFAPGKFGVAQAVAIASGFNPAAEHVYAYPIYLNTPPDSASTMRMQATPLERLIC